MVGAKGDEHSYVGIQLVDGAIALKTIAAFRYALPSD
jgi:hypothetical protein